jgi:hypothetical protein
MVSQARRQEKKENELKEREGSYLSREYLKLPLSFGDNKELGMSESSPAERILKRRSVIQTWKKIKRKRKERRSCKHSVLKFCFIHLESSMNQLHTTSY